MTGLVGIRVAANSSGPGDAFSGSSLYPGSSFASGSSLPPSASSFDSVGGVGSFSSANVSNSNSAYQDSFSGNSGNQGQAQADSTASQSSSSGGGDNTGKNPGRASSTRRRMRREDNKDSSLREPQPADNRIKAATSDDADMFLGLSDLSKEGQSGNNDGGSFLIDSIPPALNGVIQNFSPSMAGMQSLLGQIPDSLLGQFIGNLPPSLQSLLPAGMLPGVTGGNTINLSTLQGLASQAGISQNTLSGLLGSTVGSSAGGAGNLPNLANGFQSSAISGLAQSIPSNIAQSLFNPSQLTSMLPANLQNLIPLVSPIFANGAENFTSAVANAAPQMAPNSDQSSGGQGNSGCNHVDPSNDGKNNTNTRYIDYTQMLSQNFSLGQLTLLSGVAPGRYPLNGKNLDKITKSLSGVAENVLEPLKTQYGAFTIVGGWRDEGEHKDGTVVDLSWACSQAKLMEIAQYVQNSLPVKEVQMNQGKGNVGWLHIKYDNGSCGASAQTNSPAGGQTSGLVDWSTIPYTF